MKIYLTIAITFLNFSIALSQWINLNSNINDNLTGISFLEENGFVSGEKGIYYSTDSGINWTRFTIIDPMVSIIYENTKFSDCHAISTDSTQFIFVTGQTKDTKKAVLFKISIPDLTTELSYLGQPNSNLKALASDSRKRLYAVGDNKLFFKYEKNKIDIFDLETYDSYDFTSLKISNSKFTIGTRDSVILSGSINYLKVVETPDIPIHFDVARSTSDKLYSLSTTLNTIRNKKFTEINKYAFGPLNGNALLQNGYTYFIGTDHGVFKYEESGNYNQNNGNNNNFIEWQSSSKKYHISNFTLNKDIIYAVGNNGIILKTTNKGGSSKPYLEIYEHVFCNYQPINFNAITGTSTECQWYRNGQLFHNGCDQFTYKIDSLGEHLITLKGKNIDGESTTISKNINVVELPNKIDFHVTDSILCHEENVEIVLSETEKHTQYFFNNGSGMGDGGPITFFSNPISKTGDYRIEAKSTLADCKTSFAPIHIKVEKTEAIVRPFLINAKKNESIPFYNNSIEAQIFDWSFNPNATPEKSNKKNVTASFSQIGSTEITLDTWSDAGCHSAIEFIGPEIYQPISNLEPWFLTNKGKLTYPYNTHIASITKIKNGFIVFGTYSEDEIFDSNLGRTYAYDKESKGAFAAIYSFDGALKWMVHSVDKHTENAAQGRIYSAVEDQEGNIYLAGNCRGTFYDATGKGIEILHSSNWFTTNFLFKLDAQGKFINHIYGQNFAPKSLSIDKENNLILSGYTKGAENQMYNNGDSTFVIKNNYTTSSSSILNTLKLDPNGELIWSMITTGGYIDKIRFDQDNNLIMLGNTRSEVRFFPTNSTLHPLISYPNKTGYQKLFIAKFNSDGKYLWSINSYTDNEGYDKAIGNDLVVDIDGSCYVTGQSNTNFLKPSVTKQILITNSGVDNFNGGPYFIFKIDKDGNLKWINGANNYLNSSVGNQIILENNKLHVIGGIYSYHNVGAQFKSKNGVFSIPDSIVHFFIADYNLDGDFEEITIDGSNNDVLLGSYSKSIIIDDDGMFYHNFLIELYNGQNKSYHYFGNKIDSTTNITGFIAKFSKKDGITYKLKPDATSSIIPAQGYSVFPNPSDGFYTLTFGSVKQKIEIEVFDIIGNKIDQFLIKNKDHTKINIKDVNGVYIIKIKDGNQVISLKVVKE